VVLSKTILEDPATTAPVMLLMKRKEQFMGQQV
jgi:hypothetical protein